MDRAILVTKIELARLLGVSAPTVAAWLRRYPDLPVAAVGRKGRPWRFDPAAVRTFLEAQREAERRMDVARAERVAQFALPLQTQPDRRPSDDGRSPAELLAMVRVRRAEREEAVACGRLVDAAKARASFADVLGRLGRDMRGSVRRLLAEHGVAGDAAAAIEAAVAEQQHQAVARISADLGAAEAASIEPTERPVLRLVAG